MGIEELQTNINVVFKEAFGRTPLNERTKDIMGEAIELCRYTDIANLKEETGDLLCTLIQLCNENEWDASLLVEKTLQKIKKRYSQYKTLGRKTKVAILGGAFNPIHKGHIEVAKAVLDWSKTFDEVWLMPCYQHLYSKVLVSSKHRLEMCRIAARVDARIKVFNYEIEKQLKGETYHFVKTLLEEDFAKHEYDFSLIIGQDNANSFDKWVNYEFLEKAMRFIVVPRSGIEFDPKINWYLNAPHIYLTPEKSMIKISSTEIKEILKNKEVPSSELFDPEVYKYIQENNITF